MSGGGGGQTTTTGLPDEYKPLAKEYADRASGLSNEQFNPYTGQRFAGFTGDQQNAFGMVRDRALNGSPVMDQANDTLTQTLQGGQTNPYLDQMVNSAQGNLVTNYNNVIRPQQDAMAARSGSFGNSGVQATVEQDQQALGKQLGDISTQMYGQAYEGDRSRQMQALGMAPTFGNQAYTDAQQLAGVGNQQQQFGQQQQDFNYQQFLDKGNQAYKNLQTLGAPLSQNFLGSVSQTTGGGK